jgi:hypothetical protein
MDAFTVCDNALTHKCNGEVEVLVRAAQGYGVLPEKARARIAEICSRCKNFSCRGKRIIREPERQAV